MLDTVKPFPKKTFLEFLNNYLQLKRLFVVWKGEFKKITHYNAIELLQTSNISEKPKHGEDLSSEAENALDAKK